MVSRNSDIQDKIKSVIETEGVEVLDFKIFPASGRNVVRCTVDYIDGGITMGDCAKINKKVFSYLDETNILGGDYVVEINSPGLDRPLKSSQDFLKVKGKAISLWLNEPVGNKDYLEGELKEVDENKLLLELKGEVLEVFFSNIRLGKEKIEIK